jgi:hypothetical protein
VPSLPIISSVYEISLSLSFVVFVLSTSAGRCANFVYIRSVQSVTERRIVGIRRQIGIPIINIIKEI